MQEALAALLNAAPAPAIALLWGALGLYGTALAATLLRWPGEVLLRLGIALHLLALIGRGAAIQFFPLTNKLESFSAAALAVAAVAALTWRDVRLYTAPLIALACAALGAALSFPHGVSYPPPLMRTLWYPLHVPLSFLAYATWAGAAAAGLVWLRGPDPEWLARVDTLALRGFALWSASMICGGVWGVLAWGAYFMWDVKIIWSVILWLHYASFIHLRMTPSLAGRPWIRPALALVGLLWVLVAYVGTSFLFGKSSHAF